MNISLLGKKAVVCGSTQGIGKAVALALAELGAEVVLVARNRYRLQSALEQLTTTHGQNHSFVVADFSHLASTQTAIEQFINQQNGAHILINNTGGPATGALLEAENEEITDALSQHLLVSQAWAKALVPYMQSEKYGRIINITSTSVKEPLENLGVSGIARWAVASWAKILATELGAWGITVNNVLPGFTNTERLADILQKKAQKTGKNIEVVIQEAQQSVPLKRFAEPAEIANAVAFLATPAASYISGTNLVVDGGRTKSL